MGAWSFKDYWTEDGRNLTHKWYEAQDEEVQAAFDGTLLRLRAVDNWLDRKVKEFALLTEQHAGLGEIRFKVEAKHKGTGKKFQRRFRPVGLWRPEQRTFIFLLSCEKTGGSYKPHGAFDLALQYKASFEQGRGTSVSISESIWSKLRRSKRYREEFVADFVKRSIPYQARAILAKKGLTQQTLAERSGLSQGAVSRAIDPSYGNLTLNTIIRVAAGFDVAFIGKFVPFSELAEWYECLPAAQFDVPSFTEEDEESLIETTALRPLGQEGSLVTVMSMTCSFSPKAPAGTLASLLNTNLNETSHQGRLGTIPSISAGAQAPSLATLGSQAA